MLRRRLQGNVSLSYINLRCISSDLSLSSKPAILSSMSDELEIDPELLENPVFQRVLADSLSIQDRFSAEPIYAKTGKGFLKSAGVEELKKEKETQKG